MWGGRDSREPTAPGDSPARVAHAGAPRLSRRCPRPDGNLRRRRPRVRDSSRRLGPPHFQRRRRLHAPRRLQPGSVLPQRRAGGPGAGKEHPARAVCRARLDRPCRPAERQGPAAAGPGARRRGPPARRVGDPRRLCRRQGNERSRARHQQQGPAGHAARRAHIGGQTAVGTECGSVDAVAARCTRRRRTFGRSRQSKEPLRQRTSPVRSSDSVFTAPAYGSHE